MEQQQEFGLRKYPFLIISLKKQDIQLKYAGSAPPIDPGSISGSSSHTETSRFLEDLDALEIFNNALSLSTIIQQDRIKSFTCLYLVGGHGRIEDFPNNQDIKEAIEYFYSTTNGCIAAICHGNLGLTHCNDNNNGGLPLLKGKFVAAFSNEEEECLGLLDVVKVKTEDKMDESGAICVPCEPW